MSEENTNSSLDVLGIKPIGDTALFAVTKSFEGIEGFLKMVCVPALEEIGLLLKDNVRYWRLKNILKMLDKAKGKLNFENEQLHIQAHPRVALSIIENSSLIDNDVVQDMWAGLFAASCTTTGQEDENLIFVDLLKQLTFSQAKILKYSCENAGKITFGNGLLGGVTLQVDGKILTEITDITDIHRLDRELDHLCSIGLIGHGFGGGFQPQSNDLLADITPTYLALSLYVRSQGSHASPNLYWNESIITLAKKLQLEKEALEEQNRKNREAKSEIDE